MLKTYNPAGIAGPFGHYDHGVEAVDVSRLLHVSGQVGTDPDGTVPEDVAAQIERVWLNIEAVLAEAGMTTANIVRTITYMLDADCVPLLAAARRQHLGADHKAASTTIVVAGLVKPEWKVEIDAVAVA
ncbi:MAG: RidA family protein [Rhodospirillales bacterium]|nr:RidA family protein [Rhodospirillales bacterium]MDE0381845.1 RidA family protein [Rhodospirillales bacterium]